MPHSTEYSAMDLKTVSWLGNIYEKFEALCLEVEDVIYQDTVKYVESQVQTVGASVKQLYSEVVQDLHPESYVDPVKVARNDSSQFAQNEIEKKAKAYLKEQPRGIDMKLVEDTQVITGRNSGKNNLGGIYEGQSLGIRDYSRDNHTLLEMSESVIPLSEERNRMSSVCENREGYSIASEHMTVTLPLPSANGCASGETVMKICNHISDTNMPELVTSIDGAASDRTLSAELAGHKQEDSECTSSLARGCASKEMTMETCDHIPDITMPVISSSTDAAASDMTSSVESSGLLVEDFAFVSSFGGLSSGSSECTHINDDRVYQKGSGTSTDTIGKESAERSDDYNSDVVKMFDVIEQEVEIVELNDEQRLEEICVLVEGDRLHFPQQSVQHKSYKKKIREAFSSKKRSIREYERLTAQHECQPLNQDAEENVVTALVAKSDMKLSASDFLDSEWELI